jgi:hypothetical protein
MRRHARGTAFTLGPMLLPLVSSGRASRGVTQFRQHWRRIGDTGDIGADGGDRTGPRRLQTSAVARAHCRRRSALHLFESGRWLVASSSPPISRRAFWLLRQPVSRIAQLIPIARQIMQPRLDGFRRHLCRRSAGFSGFPPIIRSGSGWASRYFIHKPQDSRGAADREALPAGGQRNHPFLTLAGAVR